MNIFNFLHAYTPNPVALSLGSVTIYWYGVIMAISIIVGILMAIQVGRRRGIAIEEILDVATAAIIGGLIGARLYEIGLEWSYYSTHLSEIIKVWNGGLAIHGALIGGAIAVFIVIRNKTYNIWNILAVLLPGVALAQAIGRIGNWFNQELFGLPTNLPWGIIIDQAHRPLQYMNNLYFHPTFLYEAKLLGLLAIILYYFARKKQFPCSYIVAIYLIGQGLIRFSLEFIKIDSTPIVAGLRWPQVVSLVFIFLGIYIARQTFLRIKKSERSPL